LIPCWPVPSRICAIGTLNIDAVPSTKSPHTFLLSFQAERKVLKSLSPEREGVAYYRTKYLRSQCCAFYKISECSSVLRTSDRSIKKSQTQHWVCRSETSDHLESNPPMLRTSRPN
jgi:hypothetical protein